MAKKDASITKTSQTFINRLHLGQRKFDLIRQVTYEKSCKSYEKFNDRTSKR